eukprot:10121457-Alexandrium_andersonii.AAC.1
MRNTFESVQKDRPGGCSLQSLRLAPLAARRPNRGDLEAAAPSQQIGQRPTPNAQRPKHISQHVRFRARPWLAHTRVGC